MGAGSAIPRPFGPFEGVSRVCVEQARLNVTNFDVGERYTRDQVRAVRAALGLPPMSGGDWATGYARFGDEVFVFCNIGAAGRTGHDYPNRWIDDALDWFGKTRSTPDQPMIKAMATGAVTTHVFWRGRDRAPFIYAGVGTDRAFGARNRSRCFGA